MLRRTLLGGLLLLGVLLVLGCVPVAGRLRPSWSPVWSDSTCHMAVRDFHEVAVLVTDDKGQTLPGATVRGIPLASEAGKYEQVQICVTSGEGACTLRLRPGAWTISAELYGAYPSAETLVIESRTRCRVEFHLSFRQEDVITSAGRLTLALQPTRPAPPAW